MDDDRIEITLHAWVKPYPDDGSDQYDKIEDRLIGVLQQSGEVQVDHVEVVIPDALKQE